MSRLQSKPRRWVYATRFVPIGESATAACAVGMSAAGRRCASATVKKKALVVYASRAGSTGEVAQVIAERLCAMSTHPALGRRPARDLAMTATHAQ
jgi:hypothetical protein